MKKIYALFLPLSILVLFFFCRENVKAQCAVSIDKYMYLCNTDSVTLDANPTGTPPFTYIWSTGQTTEIIHSIVPTAPNFIQYFLTVTDATGCVAFGVAHVKYTAFNVPDISINHDDPCEGDIVNLTVNVNLPGVTILWSTGSTFMTIQTGDPGTYSVTLTDPATGCTFEVSKTISFLPTPQPVIQAPATLCSGQSTTLSMTGGPFCCALWSTGEFTQTIQITEPGTYSVQVAAVMNGCVGHDTITILPGGIAPILDSPPSLCAGQSGTIDITNAPLFTNYQWSSGATTPAININGPGTYSVTVTESGGCTSIGSVTVSSGSSNITLSGTESPVTSCTSQNGFINLSVIPSGTYTYDWSNGTTTQDPNNLSIGTYTVTVTDAGGCTSSSSYTVTSNLILPNPTTTFTAASCSLNNGAVNLSVTPAGTYTYLWSNGQTTEDLTNISAGTYSVTVTSTTNGCTGTTSVIIPTINNTISITGNAAPLSSCTSPNGAIDISPNPAGTYTFVWSNGSTTEDLTNLSAGNYTVTVSSSAGCTGMATFNVVNNTTSPVPTATPTAATCGQSNGAIDLNVTPAGTYIYVWSNGSNTEDLTSIPSGNYSVTVTSIDGCTNTTVITVQDNAIALSISGTASPNTSCINQNGAIDLTVNPSGIYSYVWSNGETTEDLQSLSGGTYNVTVTGINGCISTASFDIINSNSNFSFNDSVLPNTSCTSPNGSIDLTLTPVGSYSFAWSTGATTEDLQNLSIGNYSVTITDINNCSVVSSFSIGENLTVPQISSQVSPTACGNNNGAIDITVIPLNGNTFSWSDGSTSEDLLNLAAGNYTVTVTGLNGCIIIDTIIVDNQNSNFTLQGVSVPNNSCLLPNGSIDVTVTPSGIYTYLWADGATTEDHQNIAGGSYIVTVTDNLNCSATDTFIVANNTTIPTVSANITPANCGINNGSIDLNVNPVFNTTFLWSNAAYTEDLQNIFPGSYIVTVTDTTNACQVVDTFTIQNINNNFSISGLTSPNTSCTIFNGTIDLNITPAGSYTFIWSNGMTSEDLTALNAGSYSVTVTDNLTCSSSAIFIVDDNLSVINISTNITPSTCGNNNGAVDLTIIPSAGNTFLWSNGATTEDLQNILSGMYSLTITGSNGCTTSDTFLVPDVGSAITLSALPVANTNCILPNGSIDLSAIPTGAYTYLWSNGLKTEDLLNILPGNYSVTVSDSNGCSSVGSYTVVDQTITLSITENILPSTCGQNNGQIDISISPVGNYQYIWSTGDINEDLQNVSAGTYSVTVTGDNGCSGTAIFVVQNTNSNFSVSASTSENTSCTNANGAINLTVVPAGSYTFLWSNGATTEDIQNLPSGIYTVTVSDISNCSTTGAFDIVQNVVDLQVEETILPSLCSDANGRIDLNVTPPDGNTFIWSDGTLAKNLDNLLPGLFSVTVTGQNGCTWSSEFNVPGNEKPEISIAADALQTDDEFVTIRAQISIPLTEVDTLIWLPENLFSCTQDFCLEQTIVRPSQKTEIMVMVVDTNGCTAEARLLLDEETNPQVYIPNVFSPNGDGVNDLFTINGNKDIEEIVEMRIFDRWGNYVFVNTHFPPNDENYGWDGSFKNSEMNPAVYAYWAQVRFTNGAEGFYKGDITLVR